MLFADLTDTDFSFQCDFAGDACEYWDYELTVTNWDEKYYKSLSRMDIEQLRENCQRILAATEQFQGGM